ncbi:hypothetical protein [Streptomyces sp. NPDC052107]|uniref:hypothetical protein n=1 Tax=Streptomyces sp. NPDC052107 TaxID=3155632 RepID=UPI003448C768
MPDLPENAPWNAKATGGTGEPAIRRAAVPETDAERRRRRARFLRDLAEAARLRQAMRMRTFRW